MSEQPCTHGHQLRRKCGICDREDDQREIADLRRERDALKTALLKYSKHLVWCDVYNLSRCTCGLEELRK
jgi:hypothetical protein